MIDYLNTLNVHQHKLSLRNSLACYAVFWCVCQACYVMIMLILDVPLMLCVVLFLWLGNYSY